MKPRSCFCCFASSPGPVAAATRGVTSKAPSRRPTRRRCRRARHLGSRSSEGSDGSGARVRCGIFARSSAAIRSRRQLLRRAVRVVADVQVAIRGDRGSSSLPRSQLLFAFGWSTPANSRSPSPTARRHLIPTHTPARRPRGGGATILTSTPAPRRAANPIPRGLPGAAEREWRRGVARERRGGGAAAPRRARAAPARGGRAAAPARRRARAAAGSASSPSSSGGASHAAGWAAAALGWACGHRRLPRRRARFAGARRARVGADDDGGGACAGLARAGAPAAARQLALGAVGVGAALLHPTSRRSRRRTPLALPIFARLGARSRAARRRSRRRRARRRRRAPAALPAVPPPPAAPAAVPPRARSTPSCSRSPPRRAAVAARRVGGGGGGGDAPPRRPADGCARRRRRRRRRAATVGWAALLLLILLVVALLLVQLSVAVLIDALADARERSAAAQADAEHRCFVCGAGRAALQRGHSRGFAHHVRHVHSPLDYFALVLHLRAAPRARRAEWRVRHAGGGARDSHRRRRAAGGGGGARRRG